MISYPPIIDADDRKRLLQIMNHWLAQSQAHIDTAKAGPYGQGETRWTREEIAAFEKRHADDEALRDRIIA